MRELMILEKFVYHLIHNLPITDTRLREAFHEALIKTKIEMKMEVAATRRGRPKIEDSL